MAAELVADLLEKILIWLDVKELIQFKRVFKSWHSLISRSHFIKAHLNHNISSNIKVHKTQRIETAWLQGSVMDFQNEDDRYLLGSSNGLVCMSSIKAGILVANPLTNEARKLQINEPIRDFGSLGWGFGYDSSTDDYKVILGVNKRKNRTRFQVLSLKSNVWRDVGEVKYRCISRVGI